MIIKAIKEHRNTILHFLAERISAIFRDVVHKVCHMVHLQSYNPAI